MNPAFWIRKHVLALTQEQLSEALGCGQPSISRWERFPPGLFPSRYMPQIRQMALAANGKWDDRWFLEVPASSVDEAA